MSWRGKDEEVGDQGDLGFQLSLGPLGLQSAFMRSCIQQYKLIRKKLATRGGLRAFPVSTIGDTGCSATPCLAVSPHK